MASGKSELSAGIASTGTNSPEPPASGTLPSITGIPPSSGGSGIENPTSSKPIMSSRWTSMAPAQPIHLALFLIFICFSLICLAALWPIPF